MERHEKVFETIVIVVLLLLSSFFLIESLGQEYSSSGVGLSPRTIPAVVFLSIITSCFVILVLRLIDRQKNQTKEAAVGTKNQEKYKEYLPNIPRDTLILIMLMIIYVVIMPMVGFVLSFILLIFSISWLLSKNRSILKSMSIAILITFIVFLLFDLVFQVPLPAIFL